MFFANSGIANSARGDPVKRKSLDLQQLKRFLLPNPDQNTHAGDRCYLTKKKNRIHRRAIFLVNLREHCRRMWCHPATMGRQWLRNSD
jgi:hypothetical protein